MTLCSYPDQVCVYQLNSNSTLPETVIGLENQLRTDPVGKLSCENNTAIFRGLSYPTVGQTYDVRAQVVVPGHKGSYCDPETKKLIIPSSITSNFHVIIAADTSYDISKGNSVNNFSFRGVDPGAKVSATVSTAAKKVFQDVLGNHIKDFTSYTSRFTLDLPDTKGSSTKETASLLKAYSLEDGDPFVESLLFDLGRYLFISSERSNSIPGGLQGRWTEQIAPSWGADFHANINLQM
jgi:alpha-L-fucosidase 2